MNKAKAQELTRNGILILRASYDGKKAMWRIMKYSAVGSGGWRRFGGKSYLFDWECEDAIDRLVNQECNKCVTEAMVDFI